MAISVLDVRSTLVPPRIAVTSPVRTAAADTPRRLPVTVLTAAAIEQGTIQDGVGDLAEDRA